MYLASYNIVYFFIYLYLIWKYWKFSFNPIFGWECMWIKYLEILKDKNANFY